MTNQQIGYFKVPRKLRFSGFDNSLDAQYRIDYITNSWQDVTDEVALNLWRYFENINIKLAQEDIFLLAQEDKSYEVVMKFESGGELGFGWGYNKGGYECYVKANGALMLKSNLTVDYTASEVAVNSLIFKFSFGFRTLVISFF